MFPQQSEAALAALTIFVTLIRYVLFRADVQSGKTGAYHGIIRTMMERGLIDRAYILCGSHETELRRQCHEDVKEHHTAENQKKIRVIFRQDFKKNTMNTSRALIVVDETHMVAEKDQTLSRFLGKHDLSMAGTTPHMIKNDTYILSVSATPHAEESAMIHGDSGEKGRVVMSPGKGYYGPKNYYEDGHIRPVYPLHDIRGKHNFPLLLHRLAEQGPSYLLFRVSNNKQMKHLHVRLADWQANGNDLNIVEFNSEKKDKDREIVLTRKEQQNHETQWRTRIPCLEEQPAVMTVVFLKGRLRCGKRVPKQYVSLAWEMSKHANTDTIIQSLLGRLSGYDVPERRPLIFLPPALLQRQELSVVPFSDLERYLYSNDSVGPEDQKEDMRVQMIPRYASHIVPGNVVRKTNRSPCPPIRFTIPQELVRDASDAEIKLHALTIMQEHPEWISHHAVLTTEQKQEILSRLSQLQSKAAHIRHYQGTSNQGMYTAHTIAFETQTASSEHVDEFPFLTFCVVYGDFQPAVGARFRPTEGEVYAILYTEAPGLFRAIHRGSRIPLHSGATHFSIQEGTLCVPSPLSHEDEPILASCIAGSGYGFSSTIFHDPEALFQQFDHFIRIAKMGIGLFGRTFTSLREGEAIRLSRAAYGNRLEHLKEVCDRLERTHAVHIRFQEKRYRPTIVSAAAAAPVDHGLHFLSWVETQACAPQTHPSP
jgi:hypothetical protein